MTYNVLINPTTETEKYIQLIANGTIIPSSGRTSTVFNVIESCLRWITDNSHLPLQELITTISSLEATQGYTMERTELHQIVLRMIPLFLQHKENQPYKKKANILYEAVLASIIASTHK